ncbi:uncharacterized protein L203_104328 [Cryptococcus depauperatus CBS 7841]|uniref:Uncharacterized protein n=1 Tax=Cryptococcus depauperatus CBS 7841 TaxID=1295531 RepID=A0A1E3IHS3_9TREE|nr:hypothetical protein L203_03263 [Cryptococcus depauperatus CBS 7841]
MFRPTWPGTAATAPLWSSKKTTTSAGEVDAERFGMRYFANACPTGHRDMAQPLPLASATEGAVATDSLHLQSAVLPASTLSRKSAPAVTGSGTSAVSYLSLYPPVPFSWQRSCSNFPSTDVDGLSQSEGEITTASAPSILEPKTSAAKGKKQKIPRPPNSWILYRSDLLKKLKEPNFEEFENAKATMLRADPTALDIYKDGTKKQTAPREDRPIKHGSARGLIQAQVSKVLSFLWREEPPSVKEQYERLADLKKVQHKLSYPNYRFRPERKEAKQKRLRLEKEQKMEEKKQQSAEKAATKAHRNRRSITRSRQSPTTPYGTLNCRLDYSLLSENSSRPDMGPPTRESSFVGEPSGSVLGTGLNAGSLPIDTSNYSRPFPLPDSAMPSLSKAHSGFGTTPVSAQDNGAWYRAAYQRSVSDSASQYTSHQSQSSVNSFNLPPPHTLPPPSTRILESWSSQSMSPVLPLDPVLASSSQSEAYSSVVGITSEPFNIKNEPMAIFSTEDMATLDKMFEYQDVESLINSWHSLSNQSEERNASTMFNNGELFLEDDMSRMSSGKVGAQGINSRSSISSSYSNVSYPQDNTWIGQPSASVHAYPISSSKESSPTSDTFGINQSSFYTPRFNISAGTVDMNTITGMNCFPPYPENGPSFSFRQPAPSTITCDSVSSYADRTSLQSARGNHYVPPSSNNATARMVSSQDVPRYIPSSEYPTTLSSTDSIDLSSDRHASSILNDIWPGPVADCLYDDVLGSDGNVGYQDTNEDVY